MIRHTIDLTIGRPVEEVFTFLTDARNHPTWDRSSLAMEPEEPGPWRTGLRFREVRRIGGRRTEVASRIAQLMPNERMDIESLSGPPYEGHWRFAATAGGTRLNFEAQLTPTGVGRLLEPLIARSFRRQLDTNFAQLKAILETSG